MAREVPATRCWEDVAVGDELTPLTLPIPYTRAIQNVGAGRDWMRGHHEPAYAQRQGQATIFLNTTFHQALIDRVVTDWAGPRSFIQRRTLQMRSPLLAGDEASGSGKVIELRDAGPAGYALVVVEVALAHARGVTSTARVIVRLPRRGAGRA